MRRFSRGLLALVLVFGLCAGFCLEVSADYIDVNATFSVGVLPTVIVGINDTATVPFHLRVTVPTANLQPYRVYQIPWPGFSYSGQNRTKTNGTGVVDGLSWSANWFVSRVECVQVGTVFCSLTGGYICFYMLPNSVWKNLDFSIYGDFVVRSYLSLNSKSWYTTATSTSTVSYQVSFGLKSTTAQLWDTMGDAPADNTVDAINQQTEQMNQNHQETMDKLDSMTDFTGEQQSDLDTSLGSAGTDLESKLGVLSFADQALSDFIGVFADDPGPAVLTLPGFKIEIEGEQHAVWEDTPYQLSNLEEDFGPLLTVVRFGLVVLVYAALISYLGRVLDALLHGSEVKEE